MTRSVRPNPRSHRGAAGFTLVEMLVVIVIILVLMGLLAVAVRGVVGMARRSQNVSLLGSISQAVTQFKTDIGYEPPIISDYQNGVQTPETRDHRTDHTGAEVREMYIKQRYSSQFSLPAYLLGTGNLNGVAQQPGETVVNTVAVRDSHPSYSALAQHDGVPGPGIRHPGRFKNWDQPAVGGSAGALVHMPEVTGRVYGPYIDPSALSKSMQLVEVLRFSDRPLRVRRAGDPASGVFMYQFIDTAGAPLRYYRGYPVADPTTGEPSVARVPAELRDADAIAADLKVGSNTALKPRPQDASVMSAPYVLLAPNVEPGPPGGVDQADRWDSIEQSLERFMVFFGSSDPKFDPAALNNTSDGINRGKELLDFVKNCVRQTAQ